MGNTKRMIKQNLLFRDKNQIRKSVEGLKTDPTLPAEEFEIATGNLNGRNNEPLSPLIFQNNTLGNLNTAKNNPNMYNSMHHFNKNTLNLKESGFNIKE